MLVANDVERAAYEGFWDRVSIEVTKKAYADRVVAERDAAVEKLRTTVRNLKEIGMPVEQIAKVTGLNPKEVEALWGCMK